jgi:hypothetical protein
LFPSDRLKRLSPVAVEFTTPPRLNGAGTMSRLVKGAGPIDGFARMTADDSAVLLAVRLPPGLRSLAPVIVQAAERDPVLNP